MIAFLDLIDSDENKKQFEYLYYKYRNLMAFIAQENLSNQEDVEDAVQDAFIYIAKNFDKIDDVDSKQTKSYISVITKGFAISKYRKERKYINDISTEDMNEYVLEDSAFDIYDKTELIMIIDTLDEEYRNLLYLTYVFGYKSKEISKMFGMSDSNVRKKIQFAKADLRNKLEGAK
ncbi:MAG: sigma-70 family RNA polymerase sigma factor [Acetobacter sp.]|nr:sigma-70 family RNA polymerase sigma factor [Bacteroides sp.]MCM1341976.1 sigma-70 family RNA polymerase sigma factor [Acetobacter sp.]MCM1434227.1 sigma-70 family RNA polymerase sigma factor [Clostridiales bacterium]